MRWDDPSVEGIGLKMGRLRKGNWRWLLGPNGEAGKLPFAPAALHGRSGLGGEEPHPIPDSLRRKGIFDSTQEASAWCPRQENKVFCPCWNQNREANDERNLLLSLVVCCALFPSFP